MEPDEIDRFALLWPDRGRFPRLEAAVPLFPPNGVVAAGRVSPTSLPLSLSLTLPLGSFFSLSVPGSVGRWRVTRAQTGENCSNNTRIWTGGFSFVSLANTQSSGPRSPSNRARLRLTTARSALLDGRRKNELRDRREGGRNVQAEPGTPGLGCRMVAALPRARQELRGMGVRLQGGVLSRRATYLRARPKPLREKVYPFSGSALFLDNRQPTGTHHRSSIAAQSDAAPKSYGGQPRLADSYDRGVGFGCTPRLTTYRNAFRPNSTSGRESIRGAASKRALPSTPHSRYRTFQPIRATGITRRSGGHRRRNLRGDCEAFYLEVVGCLGGHGGGRPSETKYACTYSWPPTGLRESPFAIRRRCRWR